MKTTQATESFSVINSIICVELEECQIFWIATSCRVKQWQKVHQVMPYVQQQVKFIGHDCLKI